MSKHVTIPADRIPVSLFREILIWPLALHLPDDQSGSQGLVRAVTLAVDRITGSHSQGKPKWQPIDDPINHIPPPRDPTDRQRWEGDCYAEGVYFHEFVQSFLFSAREPRPIISAAVKSPSDLDPAPFRLFQRTDLSELAVKLPGRVPLDFQIERLNLYLFRTGAAILVLEIAIHNGYLGGLNFADVLTFRDFFRRVYPPFGHRVASDDGITRLIPGLVAESVIWRFGPGSKDVREFTITPDVLARMVARYNKTPSDDKNTRRRRFAPIFEHWRWLLEDTLPLAPLDDPADATKWQRGEGRWHQVMDERMPTIATVSVCGTDEDPRYYFDRTRRGDLIRLCFADRFDADAYPYDPHFLSYFDRDHVYDRFRQDGTLYLASGYSFVAYGACRDENGFSFFENVIGTHMRRNYFQMGLLAHFELASLLSFSSRISRAVEHHDAPDPADFETLMEVIEDEFLQFIHRFRFTGVSNHLQAQELFELWRRHLRLNTIFEDLHTEITSATRYLGNRAAARSARSTWRLTMLATFGAPFALAFGLLGMNVMFDSNTMGPLSNRWLASGAVVVGMSALFTALVAMGWWFFRDNGKRSPSLLSAPDRSGDEARAEASLRWVIAGLVILAFILAFASLVLEWAPKTASPAATPSPPQGAPVSPAAPVPPKHF